jgi:hypothetical protein
VRHGSRWQAAAVGEDGPGGEVGPLVDGEVGPGRAGPELGPPEETEGPGDAEVLSDGEGAGGEVEDGAVVSLNEGIGQGEGDGGAVAKPEAPGIERPWKPSPED